MKKQSVASACFSRLSFAVVFARPPSLSRCCHFLPHPKNIRIFLLSLILQWNLTGARIWTSSRRRASLLSFQVISVKTNPLLVLLVLGFGMRSNSVHPVAGQASLGTSSSARRVNDSLASGGGFSQNGKFSYGYASCPGKRSSMEDFYETRIDGVDGEIVGLFGVFDGHGGARAAEYVKQHLFSNLIRHPKFISDTKSAIADAYNHTDSEFLKTDVSQTRDAGSTASTAILVGDRLLVANVGDSRAVICRGGNAIAVSRDHKPDQTDERQRIENAGGYVIWAGKRAWNPTSLALLDVEAVKSSISAMVTDMAYNLGTWRVGGVLAVSRAFGDRFLKQFVVADPEIQEEVVDSSLEFLILASDGLWDVVTNEEAVSMIKPIEDPEMAARRLMQEAFQRGSADNITCVVVRFLAEEIA